jgi:hypothetical protein
MLKFLFSDGIDEQYIDRTYSSHGGEVFAVKDLLFGANSERPNLQATSGPIPALLLRVLQS